jgi:hypothetical protein
MQQLSGRQRAGSPIECAHNFCGRLREITIRLFKCRVIAAAIRASSDGYGHQAACQTFGLSETAARKKFLPT